MHGMAGSVPDVSIMDIIIINTEIYRELACGPLSSRQTRKDRAYLHGVGI